MKRALILVALAAAVSGCATIKGWFGDSKAENIEPPTALVEFPQTISVQKVWSERVGKGSQHTGARMSMAYADGKLYAASATGDIAAFDATNGHTIWHKQIGERHGWIWHHGDNSVRWSGGPTVAGDLVVVGTLEGKVYGLAASDGAERARVVPRPGQVVLAAALGGTRLAVLRTDTTAAVGDTTSSWVIRDSAMSTQSSRK